MTETNRSADDATDTALIARWKAGDERAATQLVARHANSLARFASTLGERDDIEELVQDTFVRAFGSIDSFRGDSSLRTWLFTIERRLVVDRRRAARRRKGDVQVQEDDLATEFTALDGVVADETEKRLVSAMSRLSPMQKEVFTLRVSEGMSYRDIAALVGSTEGAARVHYHNALRAVKELLDE